MTVAGLCVRCGERPVWHGRECFVCAEWRRARQREWWSARHGTRKRAQPRRAVREQEEPVAAPTPPRAPCRCRGLLRSDGSRWSCQTCGRVVPTLAASWDQYRPGAIRCATHGSLPHTAAACPLCLRAARAAY
ncbi:hypothetical protein AMOR_39910 [Anaeromyxobacter oryzae]|uniref:Uncharacterized protein n=1 Tax=Anaeromyxobacter oryzae TaxID=2918170 RepID=A0ABN6MZ87_9BACT|nr:hypothetical protein AMOR_39910 [Anaeromyxobacter oryzae]